MTIYKHAIYGKYERYINAPNKGELTYLITHQNIYCGSAGSEVSNLELYGKYNSISLIYKYVRLFIFFITLCI